MSLSTGTELYAKTLLKIIDPTEQLIPLENHRYRQACWPVVYEVKINDTSIRQTLYAKDLSLFRKDLSRVVLIDNSLFSFMLQPDNGIPIKDWRGSSSDTKPTMPAESDGDSQQDVPLSTSSNQTTVPSGSPVSTLLDNVSEADSSSVTSTSSHIPERLLAVKPAPFVSKEFEVDGINPSSETGTDHETAVYEASEGSQNEQNEEEVFGDFYPIKQVLEKLENVDDVKPVLRHKFRLVDHIVRRCISGMMISNRAQ